jgi:dCTP deaminase
MILSDRDLKIELESGRVVVDPLGANAIQPSSIDLRIGRHFRIFANTRYPFIDVRKPMEGLTELVEVTGEEPFILHPGEFVLGTTLERVAIPDDLVGRLEGKSSLGRLGLLIHSTAGFVDAGFAGNLTLELSNVANLPITLYPGMKIGQISLFRMSSPAEHPYGSNRLGSKYLDQVGPTPSRYWENFEVQTEAPDGPSSKRPSSK